jgi:hypothetical protein
MNFHKLKEKFEDEWAAASIDDKKTIAYIFFMKGYMARQDEETAELTEVLKTMQETIRTRDRLETKTEQE